MYYMSIWMIDDYRNIPLIHEFTIVKKDKLI